MATTKVSLKLLIDRESQKVLLAEAGKDFVDFLFSILSLPMGSVIRLLTKKDMVGCVANLYQSVENLNQDYIQPNQKKDTLLKPTISTAVPFLTLTATAVARAPSKTFYNSRCGKPYCSSLSRTILTKKIAKKKRMSRTTTYAASPAVGGANKVAVAEGGGFVKGVVTYMVMDDLVVTPMSIISGLTLINKFNIRNVGVLEEKVVYLGMKEGLMLLKASLKGKTALTSVFLGRKWA